MLICEIDRVRRAESDAAGSDPNSGGKKEETDSEENQDGSEKLFTESQVNKIVQQRLEKDRLRVDKEVENKLKELGIESPEDAAASREWRREKEELIARTARERELLQSEIAERESRFGEQARKHEDEKREWRQKYESLLKRAELTQTALKAGADPANVDMIVTFTEGNVRVTDAGSALSIPTAGRRSIRRQGQRLHSRNS
jgi:phytoene dehydrogenase-like protein